MGIPRVPPHIQQLSSLCVCMCVCLSVCDTAQLSVYVYLSMCPVHMYRQKDMTGVIR